METFSKSKSFKTITAESVGTDEQLNKQLRVAVLLVNDEFDGDKKLVQ